MKFRGNISVSLSSYESRHLFRVQDIQVITALVCKDEYKLFFIVSQIVIIRITSLMVYRTGVFLN